jgi:hypothetical protein
MATVSNPAGTRQFNIAAVVVHAYLQENDKATGVRKDGAFC